MATQTPLQIFRPGNHTAMSGAVLAFSESDLVACAKAYDPAKHEAPLVVGHPQHNAPAYGWVKSLSVSDGLQAVPDQVDPAFAELVAAGRFKKISASFYSPNSPQNPVPGVYYLRHVGFLGAQPPAVKGLRSPEFAEGEEGVVQFGDMELDDQINAGLWRKMREWIIGRFGQADADQVVSNDDISTLEQAARDEAAEAQAESQDAGADAGPGFTEPTHEGDAMSAEDQARLAALEAENKRLKADAEARDRTARHASHASFAEGLVREGKLLPGHQDRIVSFMDYIAGADTADVVEFSEAGGTKKCAPLDAFKDYLVAQPKLIDFAERAGSGSSGAVELTDPKAIVSAANKYVAEQEVAGNSIQFAEAVAHVVAQSKQ